MSYLVYFIHCSIFVLFCFILLVLFYSILILIYSIVLVYMSKYFFFFKFLFAATAKQKTEEAGRSEAKFLKMKAWSKSRIRQLEEELKKSQVR